MELDNLHGKHIERRYFDLDDHSYMPRNIHDFILQSKRNDLTIHGVRIVLMILVTLKKRQLFEKKQLNIFDKEFGDITSKNEGVTFHFLWKDFLPEGSRNYKEAEKGLRELASYSGKHKFTNELGQEITVISSIISDVVINKHQNGLKFNMNLTWYRLFLQLLPYNKFPNKLIFNLSSFNAVLWYFYILKMPPKKKHLTGQELFNKSDWYGPISMNKINDLFFTKHKHWSKVEEKQLKVVKKTLDAVADLSFNYKIGKDKNLYLITYHTKNSVPITFKDETQLKIARTLKYQRNKYKLNEVCQQYLENFYKKYGYEDVYHAINRQAILKDKTGMDYINAVHSLIMAHIGAKS